MSITTTYNFDNASNFTLTQAQIEAAAAKLAITSNPGQTHNATLSAATLSSAIEYSSPNIRQIDQTPATSVMAASLVTKDLLWHKSGSTTGTLNGSPTFTGTKMDCTGAQGVYWDKTSSAVETIRGRVTTPFSGGPSANINIYSTSPASGNADRFNLTYSPSGNNLRVTLYNSSGVSVISTATIIGGAITAVLNQEYEFAVVLDSTAGTVRVFVDGVLHGTLSPGAWTRGSVALRYYVGADPSLYNNAQTLFRDMIYYSSALWTATYTPGYTIPATIYFAGDASALGFTYAGVGDVQAFSSFSSTVTSGSPRFTVNGQYWTGSAWAVSAGTYAQANDFATINTNIGSLSVSSDIVTITAYFTGSNTQGAFSALSLGYTGQQYFTSGRAVPTATVPAQQILVFSASGVTEPTNTSAKWVIYVDGVPKYWNGSAWVTSDLSSGQSNTAADVNTNAPTLALSSNAEVSPALLLFTTDQQATASVASASMTYDFGGIIADPNVCIVWGYYKDVTGAPVEGATVTFELVRPARRYFEAASAIIEKKKVVITDANGYFEAELIRSSEYEPGDKTYKITIVKEADDLDTSRLDADSDLTFEVPDQSNVDITTLLTAGA